MSIINFLLLFAPALGLGTAAAATVGGSAQCRIDGFQFYQSNCLTSGVSGTTTSFTGSGNFVLNGQSASGATVNGYFRAEYGDVGLKLAVNGYAHDQFAVQGTAGANAGWIDSVLVQSATLAIGSTVNIDFLHTVSADIFLEANRPAQSSSVTLQGILSSYTYMRTPDAPIAQSSGITSLPTDKTIAYAHHTIIQAKVGDTVDFGFNMETSFQFLASQPAANIHEAASFNGVIEAGNSGHVFISALTADVFLLSGSGHDYSAPVPEPQSLILLALGLAALRLRLRP